MTKVEINTFIEEMEEIGDYWTPDQVEQVYGDGTLQDALADRRASISALGNIISSVLNSKKA